MERRPTIDIGECTLCDGCIESFPQIFHMHESGGYIEIYDLTHYKEDNIEEAIRNCPAHCISWEL